METIEKVFDQDFYRKLGSEIENDDIEVDEDGSGTYCREYEIDGYFVEACVTFKVTWNDDSFDHAFGTQYYPPYAVLENLIDIKDVDIEDGDGNKVLGFDYDQFWKQYERDTFGSIKAGDKVEYKEGYLPPKTGTFLCYCSMRNVWRIIRDADGKEIQLESVRGNKIRKL